MNQIYAGLVIFVSLLGVTFQDGTAQTKPPPADLLSAAEAGSRDAQFDMGEFYFRNEDSKDLNKAHEWYLKAAQAKHPKAQAIMGYFLANGVGVKKDLDAGVEWYKKAVAQGQHMAEFNLGLMYETGSGVPKNTFKAVELYKEAARDPRYNLPQFRIGKIYEYGYLGKADIDAAVDWYRQSGERGHAGAQFALARILEMRARTGREMKIARGWYERAAQGGVAEAKAGVARIDTTLMLTKPAEPTPDKPEPEFYPPAGKIVEYKGRRLISSAYPEADNDLFFKWMKWAIDRVDELPKELRAYPELIQDIRYNPPSKQRQRNDAYTNIVGVYTVGPNDVFPAPIIIYQDVRWGAPIHFAYSLAGNGLRAQNHKRRLEVAERLKNHRNNKKRLKASEVRALEKEHRQLLASLQKTDQESMEIYECRAMKYQFELMKLWEERSERKDAIAREMSTRGCWDK